MKRLYQLILCVTLTGIISEAADLVTKSGQVYKNFEVVKVKEDGLQIFHDSGSASIPFAELPDDLRGKYSDKERKFRFEKEFKTATVEFESSYFFKPISSRNGSMLLGIYERDIIYDDSAAVAEIIRIRDRGIVGPQYSEAVSAYERPPAIHSNPVYLPPTKVIDRGVKLLKKIIVDDLSPDNFDEEKCLRPKIQQGKITLYFIKKKEYGNQELEYYTYSRERMIHRLSLGNKKISSLTFSGDFNGKGIFFLNDDQITYSHKTGKIPYNMSVNGEKWINLEKPFPLPGWVNQENASISENAGDGRVSYRISDEIGIIEIIPGKTSSNYSFELKFNK